METITPPPTPPGPPGSPPGSPRSLPSVIVSNPPAALSKLSAGTQFEGTISTSAGRTTVQVTTQYGTLQLQTTLPLEQGARLSLILQNLIPEARVQLAAINGQPPHLVLRGGAPGQQASPAAAGGTAQPAVTATVSPQGLIGTNVMATFLRPFGANPAQTGVSPASTAPIPGGATPGGAATPQAGVQAAGGQTAGGQASAATAGQASASGPTAPGAGPAAAQGPVPAIAQGARMPLRILSIIQPPPQGTAAPPTFPAPGTTPPIPGQAITAIIGGTTAQGRPIAQTAFGPVALATKAPLAQGTQVRMEVAGQAEMPESNRPAPPPARPLGLFNAREWPALQEAVDTIRAADPAALQHLTTRAVPQANPQFSAGVLFFLSALRGGDFAGWLGNDAMRILQQTRPNLAARLGDEFQGIGAMSREPLVGDWRLALIPFFNGPDLEPLRLYLKPYGEEEEEDENKGVRFIIDVKLSRLGRVQLDGLVRDEQKRLDLIIRSEIPFEADMQNDIRTIFEDANEATGIKGGLTFQASPPGFMEIPAEGKGGSDSDVIA